MRQSSSDGQATSHRFAVNAIFQRLIIQRAVFPDAGVRHPVQPVLGPGVWRGLTRLTGHAVVPHRTFYTTFKTCVSLIAVLLHGAQRYGARLWRRWPARTAAAASLSYRIESRSTRAYCIPDFLPCCPQREGRKASSVTTPNCSHGGCGSKKYLLIPFSAGGRLPDTSSLKWSFADPFALGNQTATKEATAVSTAKRGRSGISAWCGSIFRSRYPRRQVTFFTSSPGIQMLPTDKLATLELIVQTIPSTDGGSVGGSVTRRADVR